MCNVLILSSRDRGAATMKHPLPQKTLQNYLPEHLDTFVTQNTCQLRDRITWFRLTRSRGFGGDPCSLADGNWRFIRICCLPLRSQNLPQHPPLHILRERQVPAVRFKKAYRACTGGSTPPLNRDAQPTSRLGRFTPRKIPWYPLNIKLGGSQSRPGRFAEDNLRLPSVRETKFQTHVIHELKVMILYTAVLTALHGKRRKEWGFWTAWWRHSTNGGAR
jgi:hypothetical protein